MLENLNDKMRLRPNADQLRNILAIG